MIQYLAIAVCVWWLLMFLHHRGWLPFCPFCAVKRDFVAWTIKRYRREIRSRSPLGFRMHTLGRKLFSDMANARLKELLDQHRWGEHVFGLIPLYYRGYEFPGARGYLQKPAVTRSISRADEAPDVNYED